MDGNVPRLLCGTPALPPHCVALTFDDGPGPMSAELARMLRDEGVPGTFFVLGESIERYGSALDTYRECGHAIGLHGDRHRPFRSVEHAAGELSRCAERVSGYLGDTAWFRPPYGMGDWPVPGFAGPVGWHAGGRDWDITYGKGQTVEACVDAIAASLIERDGGIALLHDFVASTEFGPAWPDRVRPGPADHRDHETADRAAARRGILVRRSAGPRAQPYAGAAGTGAGRGSGWRARGARPRRGTAGAARRPPQPEGIPRGG